MGGGVEEDFTDSLMYNIDKVSVLTTFYPANLVLFLFSIISENSSIVDTSEQRVSGCGRGRGRGRDPSLMLGSTPLLMLMLTAPQTLPKL